MRSETCARREKLQCRDREKYDWDAVLDGSGGAVSPLVNFDIQEVQCLL